MAAAIALENSSRAAPFSGDGSAWDTLVRSAPAPQLLQSHRWGELQLQFGWQVSRHLLESEGVQFPVSLLTTRALPAGQYGYLPKGPMVSAAAFPGACGALTQLAREKRLIFLRVEPELPEGTPPPPGWSPAPAREPRHTRIIDLARPLDAIMSGLKPKTRYNVRLAQKRGVIVDGSDDVTSFASLTQETSARQGVNLAPAKYYRAVYDTFANDGSCKLYLARHEGRVLAGIMVLRFAGRATYLYGGSRREGHELMPSYLLHWQAITDLVRAGDREYDLGGLPPDDNPRHPWHGLWQFKSGWNGRMAAYAGAFDLPLNRPLWLAHNSLSGVKAVLNKTRVRLT